MRLLVVHAHPVPESFGTALFRTVVEAAEAAGHEVRALDLCAEGFDPVMGAEERRGYNEGAPPRDPVLLRHIRHLRWAEGIVFVYPTWWYGQPAILKGWLDRVWRTGVAFQLGPKGLEPALTRIRVMGVVTTLGSSRWLWSLVMGAPGRKILLRGLLGCTGLRTRTFWLALHDMDSSTTAQRDRFLARVRARIARLPA
ncbi:NAD(P)H-dependent oxidoreductase [Rubellimicrobium arenae]|uniref:NAD(P)H-dependent oxidoreductase n=1 Tax=Rubellimicrobium arenae TaxID=2817372 RepID=UPI001B314934|nr:NAD(P)H-dependent oxidoreductase [Rubellimicrobium arenae]